jgi:PAS domain S-box-containing protein
MAKKVKLLSDRSTGYQLYLKNKALDETAEGITISDNLQEDNPIVYANEGFERLTGYERSAVLGKNCRFLQGKNTDPKTAETIRESINAEVPCSVEILNYRKDGTSFWNLLSITPIRDESGKVTNFLGIQSDITKRKNYENALYRVSAKLEKSNLQMKKDLEDARELQLAMLPKELPDISYIDLAVAMDTAEEVGGDYYDFFQQEDTLTFTIGDATGHGLKAGTIVTATKVLFNSYAQLDDPVKILNNISTALKGMGFKHMFMAMLTAIISREKLIISSAGIPFPLLYRSSEKSVSEIPLRGMPLGSFPNFSYKSEEISLSPGDTLLFYSDGLVECFDDKGEAFEDERLKSIFYESAVEKPTVIINNIKNAISDWLGNGALRDDMTILVLQIK